MTVQINGTTVINSSGNLLNITNQNSFVGQAISDAYDNGTMNNPYVGAIGYFLRASKVSAKAVVNGSELRWGGITTGVASFPANDGGFNSDITAGPAASTPSGTWAAIGESNATYTYSSGDVQTYVLGYTVTAYIRIT